MTTDLAENAPRRSRRQELIAAEREAAAAEQPRRTRRQIRLERERAEAAQTPRRARHAAPISAGGEHTPATEAPQLSGERTSRRRRALAAQEAERGSQIFRTTPEPCVTPQVSVEESSAYLKPTFPPLHESATTAVMSAEAIVSAVDSGVEKTLEVRTRKALAGNERQAPATSLLTQLRNANPFRRSVEAEYDMRKWSLQGLAIGAATLAVVGVPLLLGKSMAANAESSLAASYVGGQSEQTVTTPASLTGDANAAAKTAVNQVAAQAGTYTCTAPGATGIRAAFAPADRGKVVYPVAQNVYRLTSPYGYRVNPIYGTSEIHAGQDFAAPMNTPIHAAAAGVVTHAGEGIEGRSNNVIVIKHEIKGEIFYTWYVHMYDNGLLVKEGDTVTAGQQIALVGSNGNSTGPHLHFEVHDANNQTMEPLGWLQQQGAVDVSQACN